MPKLTGVWDTYNGYLADRREAGATLEEIGKEVGISRERVRQILVRHYGTTEMTSLLTAGQLGRVVNLSKSTISRYHRSGVIKSANDNPQYPLYDGADAIVAILTFRRCKVCSKPLPVRKTSYCSPKCIEEGIYKAHKRSQWRALRRKKGVKVITPSTEYKRKG